MIDCVWVMKVKNNEERIARLPKERYKELFGVEKGTFDVMLNAVQIAFNKEHSQGGKPAKLSALDRLVITLCYWREYRAYQHIAWDYDVNKSTISRVITWTEDVLINDGTFALPSKRIFEQYNNGIEVIVVDATEQPIERPKKGRKSGIQERKSNTQ